MAPASPPALVDHLNVGDDVIGVEGDLVIAGCKVRVVKRLVHKCQTQRQELLTVRSAKAVKMTDDLQVCHYIE